MKKEKVNSGKGGVGEGVGHGLLYEQAGIDDWILGARGEDAVLVNSLGNWVTWAREVAEHQQRGDLETMSCVTFGTLNAIEIMGAYLREIEGSQWDGVASNYSERFTSTLAETTRDGNSPHKVAQSVRDFGLLPAHLLPWSADVQTWEQWYSGITLAMRMSALTFVRRYDFTHRWADRARMRSLLKMSPVGVGVYAWEQNDEGLYVDGGKPANHFVLVVAETEKGWLVLDSYENFFKEVVKDYPFVMVKSYGLQVKKQLNWWKMLKKWLFGHTS